MTIDFSALHVVKMYVVRPAGFPAKTMTGRILTMVATMAAPQKTPIQKCITDELPLVKS